MGLRNESYINYSANTTPQPSYEYQFELTRGIEGQGTLTIKKKIEIHKETLVENDVLM